MSNQEMEIDPETASTTNINTTTKATNLIEGKLNLVGVHYPGIVKNLDKALETLGGLRNIECVTSGHKKHLELCFRPNNMHGKPVLSDRDTKPCILVKVKMRKGIENGKVVSKEVVDYDVVGTTAINLRFNKLCDFQYLPLVSKEPKEVEEELMYVYDEIMPKEIPDGDWINSENCDEVPLFFVPYQFSKLYMHGNQLHFDRSKFYEGRFVPEFCNKFKEQQMQQKLYKRDREKLIKTAVLCRFEDDIPQEPTANAMETYRRKGLTSDLVDKLKALFAERPIWSRNALLYHTGATNEHMKFALPTVAFHYVSGPWRVMWVKFGFDPRADPLSQMLQTFDYRVRSRGGCKIQIKPKRYASHLPIPGEKFSLVSQPEKVKPKLEENLFILKPGYLPSGRQTFYQFCDVKLPEIENMLAKLPAIIPGATCDWKHGWLPNYFTDQCRELVNKYVQDTIGRDIRQRKGLPVSKGETEQPRKEAEEELSSSDSDSETEKEIQDYDMADVIDLEAVEEINQLLGHTSETINIEPRPGPSTST